MQALKHKRMSRFPQPSSDPGNVAQRNKKHPHANTQFASACTPVEIVIRPA